MRRLTVNSYKWINPINVDSKKTTSFSNTKNLWFSMSVLTKTTAFMWSPTIEKKRYFGFRSRNDGGKKREEGEKCVHRKKKWSHFDLKNWVTGGTKIRPGIPSNWLDIVSRLKLTLNIESIWLKYSPITRNPELNFSSASDSTFQVKMTQFFFQCYVFSRGDWAVLFQLFISKKFWCLLESINLLRIFWKNLRFDFSGCEKSFFLAAWVRKLQNFR